jgi:Conjugative transposon protein TcpC
LSAEPLDSGGRRATASVTLTTQRWWRIRVAREFTRYLLCALALAGIVASARFAIAPPSPAAPAARIRMSAPRDQAAEAYAVLFARRYLSWNAAVPDEAQHDLEPFLGTGTEPGVGRVLPATGAQSVQWAEVVQTRERGPGEHVYTVAAQTDTAGLLYLTVGVTRTTARGLVLAGYPAFVGAPAAGAAEPPARSREVAEPALATVVTRALRNYLGDAPGELAADLSGGARVSLPDAALSLDTVQHLSWSSDGDSVVAIVQAHDERGVTYTLEYELDVLKAQGRWEISAVQMDPDA